MDLSDVVEVYSAEKAASYATAEGVYYISRGGEYVVIDPQKETRITLDARKFHAQYAQISPHMPATIKARLDAMPPFYEWKRQCAKK